MWSIFTPARTHHEPQAVNIVRACIIQFSGGSYLSQIDLRLHFGLGSHQRVERAEIQWPDGKVENLTSLTADRFYQVREGAGVVSSTPPADYNGK